MLHAIATALLLTAGGQRGPPATPSPQDRLVAAAETMLGKPYVFGGRDGRRGCRGVERCLEGVDCQSLVFFAWEKVFGRAWTRFSVMPSVSVARGELGAAVPGLDGVLRDALEPAQLKKGDVLFFLLREYNLQADAPLWEHGGVPYGVWHVGLVHGVDGKSAQVIHAKPGERVVIEQLESVSFDALFVLRLPPQGRPGVR